MAVQTRYDGVLSSDLYDAQTTDGVLIRDLIVFADQSVAQYNTLKNTMMDFMGYETTKPEGDMVTQITVMGQRFTEFGKPDARNRTKYDVAVTTALEGWQTAIEYTAFAQVLQLSAPLIRKYIQGIFEWDLRTTYMQAWEQFFDKSSRVVEDILLKKSVTQLPFYNGDSRVPPAVGNKTFSGTHNHYLRSATTAVLVAADLASLVNTVMEHGFDNDVYLIGDQDAVDAMVAVGDPDVAIIQAYNTFIPRDAVNANQAGALVPVAVPVNGLLTVVAIFQGKAKIAVCKGVPAGYIGCFSHQGNNDPANPLQLRLAADAGLRGLRREGDRSYPFVGEYWQTLRGIGTRQYGNGAAMQWVYSGGSGYASPTYTYDIF
jgi:hypothetical protein